MAENPQQLTREQAMQLLLELSNAATGFYLPNSRALVQRISRPPSQVAVNRYKRSFKALFKAITGENPTDQELNELV